MDLRQRIVALAQRHKRYGVGMIHLKLRQAGLLVNYKRVERLYQEAKLQVEQIDLISNNARARTHAWSWQ
ncbi:hypothetical protein RLIN73S_00158 [Rhodanobacter lindaniclasticus]